MKELIVPPFAPAMLNSLRAIGYSFDAALADIVDNSVAAEAWTIDIQFRTTPVPYIAIIDDGTGMSGAKLIAAMQHGGIGPETVRAATDLGRFGLGLKTASFSQCRRLTVATLRDGELSAARWDLDQIESRGDWVLFTLSGDEVRALPHVSEMDRAGRGTVVLWEQFDRATAGESAGDQALSELMDRGREHLALAFHRYLSGQDGGRRLRMQINNVPVRPVDPFLLSNKATEPLPYELLHLDGAVIAIQPYILPHVSKLTREELALAGGEAGLRRNQGFFVYRNRRLITSGTWFRLVRQEELTKLARVQVDIPNTLDHLWALDVKKSSAHPPEAVRNGLRRVVERIADRSRQVYRFRGRRTGPAAVTHLWERIAVRDGIDYRINRDHPSVNAVRAILNPAEFSKFDQLLRTLELVLPTDSLYADMASERVVQTRVADTETASLLRSMFAGWIAAAGSDPAGVRSLVARLKNIEPFCAYPELTQQLTKELPDAD